MKAEELLRYKDSGLSVEAARAEMVRAGEVPYGIVVSRHELGRIAPPFVTTESCSYWRRWAEKAAHRLMKWGNPYRCDGKYPSEEPPSEETIEAHGFVDERASQEGAL